MPCSQDCRWLPGHQGPDSSRSERLCSSSHESFHQQGARNCHPRDAPVLRTALEISTALPRVFLHGRSAQTCAWQAQAISSMISSMTCEDARECFRVLLEGKIRLTELAGVEAHISQCAVCREELARLQSEKIPARAPRDPRAGESESAALPQGPGRRWRRLSIGVGLVTVVAIAILIALAVRDYDHNQERERFLSESMKAGRDRPDREPRAPAPPAPPETPPETPPSPAPPRAIPPVSPAPRPGVASRSAELGPEK